SLISSSYLQSGGVFASDLLHVKGGVFTQSAGTNYTGNLIVGWYGSFNLTNGEVVTSTTINSSTFNQEGGIHRVEDLQLYSRYRFRKGTLIAQNVQLGTAN